MVVEEGLSDGAGERGAETPGGAIDADHPTRRCGGQVSATSIDPSAHSPFIAKVLSARATMKTEKPGDNATIGIISENIAILRASSLRRPNRSASQGQT